MKRNLNIRGLALALALSLSCAASAAFTDQASITHAKAVDALVELGILQGRENGAFDPTGLVTRAEMAKISSSILLGGEPVFDGLVMGETVSFPDVKGHWAYDFIRFCASEGIVSGRANGTFDPDATVTGLEGAKMLLICLGYLPEEAGLTGEGWAEAVADLAKARGLLKDLEKADLTNPLTRDSAAQLVQNALRATVVYYDYVLTKTPEGELTATPLLRETKPAQTLLSLYFET